MDPIATARYGLTAATQRFEASATRIASMGVEGQDVELGHEMVEMIAAKHQFSANLSVVRFARDMWDALLDLQAR
jgi:flagellar basal body rod protein FlgC